MNNQAGGNYRTTPAIVLRDVTKRFGQLTAVANLSLAVAPGKILGFLGPNGAGKTTTIRILTGFMKPTSGSVYLLGNDMAEPGPSLEGRRRLGFVPEVAGLDAGASGRWLLNHLAQMQGRSPVDRDALIGALALSSRDLGRPMGRLSRGTRQKINIIQGLQHRPDILVLDEPTEGLDPLAKRSLFRILNDARGRGVTIFFSSHILSEVEALCDEVALIRQGRLVAVDDIDTLRATMQRRVTLQLADGTAARARLETLPTVSQLSWRDGRWQFYVAEFGPLLQLLAELPVHDVTIEPPSLEDIFMQHYEVEAKTGA
jgi:ABC-2 type transport system ATP-binding protein